MAGTFVSERVNAMYSCEGYFFFKAMDTAPAFNGISGEVIIDEPLRVTANVSGETKDEDRECSTRHGGYI